MVNFRKKSRKINSQKTNSQKTNSRKTNSQKTIKHGGATASSESDKDEKIKLKKELIFHIKNDIEKVCQAKRERKKQLEAELTELTEDKLLKEILEKFKEADISSFDQDINEFKIDFSNDDQDEYEELFEEATGVLKSKLNQKFKDAIDEKLSASSKELQTIKANVEDMKLIITMKKKEAAQAPAAPAVVAAQAPAVPPSENTGTRPSNFHEVVNKVKTANKALINFKKKNTEMSEDATERTIKYYTQNSPLALYISKIKDIEPKNKIILLRNIKGNKEFIDTYQKITVPTNFEDIFKKLLTESEISEEHHSKITSNVKQLVDNRNVDNLETEAIALQELIKVAGSVDKKFFTMIDNLKGVSTTSKILLLRNIKNTTDFIKLYQENKVGNDFENLLKIYGNFLESEIKIITAKAQEISKAESEAQPHRKATANELKAIHNTTRENWLENGLINISITDKNANRDEIDEVKDEKFEDIFNRKSKYKTAEDKKRKAKILAALKAPPWFNTVEEINKYIQKLENYKGFYVGDYRSYPDTRKKGMIYASLPTKDQLTNWIKTITIKDELTNAGQYIAILSNNPSTSDPEIITAKIMVGTRKEVVEDNKNKLLYKGRDIWKTNNGKSIDSLYLWDFDQEQMVNINNDIEEFPNFGKATDNLGGGKRRRTRWRPRKKKSNKTYRKKPKKIRQKKNKTQRKRES